MLPLNYTKPSKKCYSHHRSTAQFTTPEKSRIWYSSSVPKTPEVSAISTDTPQPAAQPVRVKFRLSFIGWPLALLAVAVILSGAFYGRLPDPAAYRFQTAAADAYLSRTALVAWMVVPHLLFTFMSWVLVSTILLSSKYWEGETSFISRVLPLMGNMTALAQAVFVLAAVQIYVYNASGALLAPFWPIAVAVLVIGGAVLFVLFLNLFRENRRRNPKPVQEKQHNA